MIKIRWKLAELSKMLILQSKWEIIYNVIKVICKLLRLLPVKNKIVLLMEDRLSKMVILILQILFLMNKNLKSTGLFVQNGKNLMTVQWKRFLVTIKTYVRNKHKNLLYVTNNSTLGAKNPTVSFATGVTSVSHLWNSEWSWNFSQGM